MCGGTLEILPCSHVGHIFRSRSPYKWRTGVNVLKRNSIRIAEVCIFFFFLLFKKDKNLYNKNDTILFITQKAWMDDYKKYYYQRIGNEKVSAFIRSNLNYSKEEEIKPFLKSSLFRMT